MDGALFDIGQKQVLLSLCEPMDFVYKDDGFLPRQGQVTSGLVESLFDVGCTVAGGTQLDKSRLCHL